VTVVDASAWLGVVAGQVPARELGPAPLSAPAHFDAEVLSGLRGLVRGGWLADAAAREAWDILVAAPVERVVLAEVPGLWDLAAAVSAYDAPYVALAAMQDVTLVTADARLARGAAGRCDVRLVG
jgi:predicted nucleic acid-binding protein